MNRRRLLFMLSVLTLALALGTRAPSAAGVRAQPAGPSAPEVYAALQAAARQGQLCAWPAIATLQTLNVAVPDFDATYWVMPYVLPPGSTLLVRGTYPFARYFSFTTNAGPHAGAAGVQLVAELADTAIGPDPGSSNPFVSADAPADPAQRRYTVRVTPGGGGKPLANTLASQLPGAEQELAFLIYRLYVPDDPADRQGGVPLPDLAVADATGGERPLTPCTAVDQATWTPAIEVLARAALLAASPVVLPSGAQAPQFVPMVVPGFAPNPHNRYLGAELIWAPGRVAVVRAKAPTFPNTRAGVPATTPTQLRFWSFGTAEYQQPYPTVGGGSDASIPVDADGFYTVVISTAEDRPVNATAVDGVAWMPWGDPAVPMMVILRNMLPAPDFAQAGQRVPDGATPEETRAIMGPYDPVAAYCDRAQFEARGAACVTAPVVAGATARATAEAGEAVLP